MNGRAQNHPSSFIPLLSQCIFPPAKSEFQEATPFLFPGRKERITAPRKIKQPLIESHQPRTHRVEMDLVAQHREVAALLRIHDDRFIPPLKKVPAEPMPRVEAHRPRHLEPAHPRDQVCLRRLQQEMVVVRHQYIGMNPPAGPRARLSESLQKTAPILVIPENRFAPVPTIQNVINGTFKFNARFASHETDICTLSPPRP